MGRTIFKDKRILPVLLCGGAFIAARVLKVNVMLIIIACGLIGFGDNFLREKRNGAVALEKGADECEAKEEGEE